MDTMCLQVCVTTLEEHNITSAASWPRMHNWKLIYGKFPTKPTLLGQLTKLNVACRGEKITVPRLNFLIFDNCICLC